MPKTPSSLVSIIIPCFNAEKYVAKAIQSALDQTYPDCEVIVIDDGSTDKSLDVIKSFGERIRWETGPNRGGCEARNRGIELARGDWIQFLDADDLLDQDAVKNKCEALAQCKSDEVICSSLEFLPEFSGATIPEQWFIESFDAVTILRHGAPQTSAPLHRKTHLNSVGGFRDGLPCCQEYDLHLRMALKLKLTFRVMPFVGTYMRLRPNSISRIAGSPFTETRSQIYLSLFKSDPELILENRAVKVAFSQAAARAARGLYRKGKENSARELLNLAKSISNEWDRAAYPRWPSRMAMHILGFDRFEKMHKAVHTGLKAFHRK